MQRETAFAGGVVVVAAAMLLSAALVPGVLAEREEEVRPSHIDIREEDATISVVDVPGETVTLQLDTRLRHAGGPAENVTVEVRAIDTDTGLLADQQRVEIGTITDDREVSVLTNVTVERAGGYRIETLVYEDGRRVARGARTIRGVEALEPEYARSPIQFQQFEGNDELPAITWRNPRVEDGRATLNVSTYLTNTGNAEAGDLTLLVRARQADSNVIADETRHSVSSIRPGRTVSPSVELTVPDQYNYWLDAILLKDGVVIGTATEPAALDPPMNISREPRNGSEFDASEFGEETVDEDRPPRTPEDERATVEEGPGFGVLAAVLGLIGTTLLVARRNHD